MHSIVIFGGSGDLTQRKLIPALYNLHRKGRMPEPFNVIGFSQTVYTHESFREHLRAGMQEHAPGEFDPKQWEKFASHVYYSPGSATQPGDLEKLKALLADLEHGEAERLYYLAVAPRFFPVIAEGLGQAGMAKPGADCRCRLVVEKPFGHDLASARELNTQLQRFFLEDQLYRIDHYLGKETAQNILFFRFANTLFELGWNRNYIDNVQISVLESVDVGHRAGYYDQAGVLRDMFQNHLLQLLALTAMEPPVSFRADAIRDEKAKLFSALRPIRPEDVGRHTIRAQYEGYRAAPDVPPDSQTPTFAALEIYIDNWRWQGVPFYLRSGKALDQKVSEILVQFRQPPHILFPLPPGESIPSNLLSICIQPDEGIHFQFQAKVPDTDSEMRPVDMDFHYAEDFNQHTLPDAYERLLLDALEGDAALFTRSDGIEAAWAFIDPILEGWHGSHAPALALYQSGSGGPVEADELLARTGRQWARGCSVHL